MPATPKRPFLQRASAGIVVGIALFATACSPAVRAQLRRSSAVPVSMSATERTIVDSVNRFRASHRLPALHPQSNLQNKARLWSAVMATGQCGRNAQGTPTICHSSLPSGITVHWSRLEENVGYAAPRTAVAAVMTGFQRSPEHAANMLNGTITQIGVGVAYSGNFVYVTEEFLAP